MISARFWLVNSLWLIPVLLTFGCREQAPKGPPPAPPVVTVRQPVQKEVTDYREYTGRIEAVETAEIRARVKGFLKKVYFKEGSTVEKDKLLYEIDPSTFQADLARAEAQVEQLKTQAALAGSEALRAARLRSDKALSEEEYAQRVAARAAAEAAYRAAQAAVKGTALELGFTKVASPITGRISRTLVTEGNLVGFGEPTLLTTVVQTDPIYVYFDVPEQDFLDYNALVRKQGLATANEATIPLEVSLANEPGFPHKGIIEFRENRLDAGTGTLQLRGELPNPENILVPGLFARVRVPFGKPRPRLLVPEVAVGTDQRGAFLLVVKEDNSVVYRPVQISRAEEGMVLVQQGLLPEDWVIVNGLQRARPGSKVTPQRAETK